MHGHPVTFCFKFQIPELRRAGVHIKHIDNVKSLLKEFVAGGKARLQVGQLEIIL